MNRSESSLKRVFMGIHFTFLIAVRVLSCSKDGGGIVLSGAGAVVNVRRIA